MKEYRFFFKQWGGTNKKKQAVPITGKSGMKCLKRLIKIYLRRDGMPAYASLEELTEVSMKLQELEQNNPEAYKNFVQLFKTYRKVGYKNICKMLLGEATPKELKGLE